MLLRERDFTRITERLITDFQGQVSLLTVIQVLRACADDDDADSPEVIERAARLSLRGSGHSGS
jgi:hypothetical protein